MISLIIQSYFTILLSISMGSVFIFITGLYFIFKKKSNSLDAILAGEEGDDITAIAGDNLLSTQLDLARAYIEIDKKQSAKKILELVIEQGNSTQQDEAKRLLSCL